MGEESIFEFNYCSAKGGGVFIMNLSGEKFEDLKFSKMNFEGRYYGGYLQFNW